MASEPWKHKNPKRKHKKMTPKQKAKARRTAHRHGRKNPSLVDNMNAMKD